MSSNRLRVVMLILTATLVAAFAGGAAAQTSESHGWLNNDQARTPYGTFQFKNGYPTADTSRQVRDVITRNRAIEVYIAQMPTVSWYAVWKGIAGAGGKQPNQLVIWERLMDAKTLLLTGNTETVYGLAAMDLRKGPIVIEVPPKMLGGVNDIRQTEIFGIGPTGVDKGQGGKLLIVPPGYAGTIPPGYIVGHSPGYRIVFAVRGFLEEGKPDAAVALMKKARVYALADAGHPPAQAFVDGSGKEIDTIFPDTATYFDDLGQIIQDEPAEMFTPSDRFAMASIGLVSGKPFTPDNAQRKLLAEAAQIGSAYARVNGFDSQDATRIVYPDRKWEQLFIGGSVTWDAQGYPNEDRRAAFSYSAIGMSPAMTSKAVGQGSQYIWTMRDAQGRYLDGATNYVLHIPPNIPVKNFWSIVVYDAQSRSLLRSHQPFPSVSQYTGPVANADGSYDIYFGPKGPPGKSKNWIETVPQKGWFVLMRFYGPLPPFFDQSWKPGDIEVAK
ncbi:DUF1254 domain-containing protein [Luteibacter aegosomatissinici]|uniref:DUF1254 domain-containing protein n=1 Tax=Luteibacter aegosomatissinici TaxID=2911539 RepID=UPI001FF8E2CD|nr:DUF1254 domain-containing protein [Luteibacter aegosomatissinici]UPG93848.1 DUF1254 domain-containing protein [Luteibacter aegosomatissinici]